MEERLFIQENEKERKIYFQRYLWKIPFGRKILNAVFTTDPDGSVYYKHYSNDGTYLVSRGRYKDQKKVGPWYYMQKTGRDVSLFQIICYDETGRKTKDTLWEYGFLTRHIHYSKEHVITFNFSAERLVQQVIKNKVNGDVEYVMYADNKITKHILDRNLTVNGEKKIVRTTFIFKDGKEDYSIAQTPYFDDMYIITRNLSEPQKTYYEYVEKKEKSDISVLQSSSSIKDIYEMYVAQIKMAKLDDESRRHLNKKLRKIPSLSLKKEFLRKRKLSQNTR